MNRNVPLLTTISTQVTEHREGELCLHRNFTPMFLCVCYRKVLFRLPKESYKKITATKPFTYNAFLLAKCASATVT